MVEEQKNKPQQGTYENLKTGEVDLKPKVEFEIGIGKEVEVVFDSDFEKPIEYPSKDDNGVFYVFNLKQNNEEKVIIITNLLISLEWGIDWDDVDKLTTYREGLLTEQWEVSDNVAAPLSSRALEDAITEMRNTRVNPIREGSLLEPTDFMATYINNLNNDE